MGDRAGDAEEYGLLPGDTSTVLVRTAPATPWQDAWPPLDRAQVLAQLDTGLALDAAQHLADSA